MWVLGPGGLDLALSAWKVGAIAGAAGGFAGGLASGGGLKGALKGAIIGGISGAAAGWIGHGSGLVGLPKALAHGVSQGAIAKLRGGDFRSGFIGGIVGGATNWVAGKINLGISAATFGGRIARAAIGGVIGGISAKITGGRFEDGAVSAAFRWLFNDAMSVAEAKRRMEAQAKKLGQQTDKEFAEWKHSLTLPDPNAAHRSRYDATGRDSFDYYMAEHYSDKWYEDPGLLYATYPVVVLALAMGGEYLVSGYYVAGNYILANPVTTLEVAEGLYSAPSMATTAGGVAASAYGTCSTAGYCPSFP